MTADDLRGASSRRDQCCMWTRGQPSGGDEQLGLTSLREDFFIFVFFYIYLSWLHYSLRPDRFYKTRSDYCSMGTSSEVPDGRTGDAQVPRAHVYLNNYIQNVGTMDAIWRSRSRPRSLAGAVSTEGWTRAPISRLMGP